MRLEGESACRVQVTSSCTGLHEATDEAFVAAETWRECLRGPSAEAFDWPALWPTAGP